MVTDSLFGRKRKIDVNFGVFRIIVFGATSIYIDSCGSIISVYTSV